MFAGFTCDCSIVLNFVTGSKSAPIAPEVMSGAVTRTW
jgi:hypothetical protein